MSDAITIATLVDEHARLFTADYDSRDEEARAFERVDEILAELQQRCKELARSPDDNDMFEALVGALASEDAEVHNAAYIGLGRLGHAGVVPLFLEKICHGASRVTYLIRWAEEADAEMAKTLRKCLDHMPGRLEDRALFEIAIHLAETRNGALRDPELLRRALDALPHELRRWADKMAAKIRALDIDEVSEALFEEEKVVPVLDLVTTGIPVDGLITGLAWSNGGERLYVGVGSKQKSGVRTFDREGTLLDSPNIQRPVSDIDLSHDGRWLAIAAPQGRSAIVDTETGEVVCEVDEGLAGSGLDAAFSPDDRYVAFRGNHVVVLSVGDWKVVDTFSLPVSADVQAAWDWLYATSDSRKGALKALAELDVPPDFRRFAEKFARGSDQWRLLSRALPDSRPRAVSWKDNDTLLIGGQAVFEKRVGDELRCVHKPERMSHGALWPNSQILSLACDGTYIWVGTRGRLARFDLDLQNEHVFAGVHRVSRIVPVGTRTLVGSYGPSGLWCIDGDTATRIDGPGNIFAVAARSDGTIWCGRRTVVGWDSELNPLHGPQHSEAIVGVFSDAEGDAITCDADGKIVHHGRATITHVPSSHRCVSAGASSDGEWIALGFETRSAGELVGVRGDEVMWRSPLRKGMPFVPVFCGEHVFFVADSKLRRCSLAGKDVRTKKLKLGSRATRVGSDVAAYASNVLNIVSLSDLKVIAGRKLHEQVRDLAGTPDGRRLCVAFGNGAVDVIDVATMQLETVVQVRSLGVVTCTDHALYMTSHGDLLKHAFGSHSVEVVGTIPLQEPWPSAIGVVGDEIWIGDHRGPLVRAPQ